MYGEWLILINWLFNILLLLFTARVTGSAIRYVRLFVFSFISSCVAIFLYPAWLSVFVSLFVLLLAFPIRKGLVEKIVVLVIATFSIGGLLTAFSTYVVIERVSTLMLIIVIAIILYIFARIILNWHTVRLQQSFQTDVELSFLNERWQLKGFIDSGNECFEPISYMPVHFISFQTVKEKLPSHFVSSLKKWDAALPHDVQMFGEEVRPSIGWITMKTVQGQSIALAFQAEQLIVKEKCFENHFVVFVENDAHFPVQSEMILHVSIFKI